MKVTEKTGMVYKPNKKYYVVGARSAWDNVEVGLFDSVNAAHGAFPMAPRSIIREATEKEIKEYFKINLVY